MAVKEKYRTSVFNYKLSVKRNGKWVEASVRYNTRQDAIEASKSITEKVHIEAVRVAFNGDN